MLTRTPYGDPIPNFLCITNKPILEWYSHFLKLVYHRGAHMEIAFSSFYFGKKGKIRTRQKFIFKNYDRILERLVSCRAR